MPVVYVRPALVIDPYSGEPDGEDWGAATRHDAGGVFVLTQSSSTVTDGTNDSDRVSWTLFVPVGAPHPEARDRIEWDGHLFAQDGIIAREENPFTGWAPYAQVRLQAVV